MTQKKRSDNFISQLSLAELNYYQKLLPPLLINNAESRPKINHCIISNCDGKADDEHTLDIRIPNIKSDTRIPSIFAHFDDTNGNDLLSCKHFNIKYKYENTIIQTTNKLKISKIKVIKDGKFKAMKTCTIAKGETYEDDRKNVNDLLSKWILMRNLGILKECEIYNDKYSINCVQKLWDIDLKTYIKNNNKNNMFSADNINTNIALLMKSIVPKIKLIHSNGIVICDIKPSNLMMNYDKNRNIPIDFGIIDFELICENKSYWNNSFGTLAYRAPEMDSESFKMSFSFDIYSLGISLLEIINGKHPYLDELIDLLMNCQRKTELNNFINQDIIDKIIEDNKWLQLPQNDDFKDLLEDMIDTTAIVRPTANEIMEHPWYQTYCSS